MKIVFMGTPDFAAVVLKGLIEADHEVVCAEVIVRKEVAMEVEKEAKIKSQNKFLKKINL